MSLSLHKIIAAFDDRCILNAQIELETEEQRENYFFLRRNNLRSSAPPVVAEEAVTVQKSLAKLTDVFNETYAAFLSSDTSLEFPADQLHFLSNSKEKFRLLNLGFLSPLPQIQSTRETPLGARKVLVISESTFPSAKPALG